MPNWVVNKVKPKKRFEEVAKYVCGTELDEDGNYQEFDFNKIMPCPKRLHITSGGGQNYAIQYAMLKRPKKDFVKMIEKFKETKCDFYGNYLSKIFRDSKKDGIVFYEKDKLEQAKKDFEKKLNSKEKDIWDEVDYKELGIKSFEDLGNAYINNIIEYGCDTWYDWCNENWGTKWNCSSVYIENGTFIFNTAWSCPYNIIKKLSEIFSDIEFEIKYADEDIGSNCGSFTMLNGVEDNFMQEDKQFAYELWGYTQEDIDECESYEEEENE